MLGTSSNLLFGLAVLAVLSLASVWGAFRVMRVTRLIEDIPTSKIRSAAQGYVEISGTAHWLPGEKILSPLSGTECIWWSYDIKQRAPGAQGRAAWKTIDQRDCHASFLLKDDTGQCVVNPLGVELLGADLKGGGDRREWYGMTATPAPGSSASTAGPPSGAEPAYRYEERVIKCGITLHALGDFRTRYVAADRSSEASATEGTHTLSKPAQGDKPFILSTRTQSELSDGSRGLASFLFACFLVSGALLVWAVAGLWQGRPERQIVYGFVSAFCLVLFIVLSVGPFASGVRILLGKPAAPSNAAPARRSRWAALPVLAFALLMAAFTGFLCYWTAVEAGLVGANP